MGFVVENSLPRGAVELVGNARCKNRGGDGDGGQGQARDGRPARRLGRRFHFPGFLTDAEDTRQSVRLVPGMLDRHGAASVQTREPGLARARR